MKVSTLSRALLGALRLHSKERVLCDATIARLARFHLKLMSHYLMRSQLLGFTLAAVIIKNCAHEEDEATDSIHHSLVSTP